MYMAGLSSGLACVFVDILCMFCFGQQLRFRVVFGVVDCVPQTLCLWLYVITWCVYVYVMMSTVDRFTGAPVMKAYQYSHKHVSI